MCTEFVCGNKRRWYRAPCCCALYPKGGGGWRWWLVRGLGASLLDAHSARGSVFLRLQQVRKPIAPRMVCWSSVSKVFLFWVERTLFCFLARTKPGPQKTGNKGTPYGTTQPGSSVLQPRHKPLRKAANSCARLSKNDGTRTSHFQQRPYFAIAMSKMCAARSRHRVSTRPDRILAKISTRLDLRSTRLDRIRPG